MKKDSELGPGRTVDIEMLQGGKPRQAAPYSTEDGISRQIVIAVDRFVLWLSKRWLTVFNALAFLYVGLPFLAPTLMKLGADRAASIVYGVYRPLCHQLPQRSWFLFGPRIAYGLPELVERVGDAVSGPWARGFVGSEAVGYKVAICQRDTAIYGTIFLSGVVYGLLRRRWEVRPLPWWAYIGLGILPMGIDGGYQFLSYALPLVFPGLSLSPHETTPLMRTVTGALFGWSTVWLAYPYVQESMDDVRRSLQRRFESRHEELSHSR